jgi:hypothetical protein
MERIPEWRGADIRITSDFEKDFCDPGYFDHDLTVRTRHAGSVTWFVFQMRDLFSGWLDYGNGGIEICNIKKESNNIEFQNYMIS